MPKSLRWVVVGAVILVGAIVFGGAWLFASEAWWPNALAELAGLIAGGVVLAVVVETWLRHTVDEQLRKEREKRWEMVLPLVQSRLRRDLAAVDILCARIHQGGAAYYQDLSVEERLKIRRDEILEMDPLDHDAIPDVIRGRDGDMDTGIYAPLCRRLREMSTQLVPLAALIDPDLPFMRQVTALEAAGCDGLDFLWEHAADEAEGDTKWRLLRGRCGGP